MIFRIAELSDIPQMQEVRHQVKESILSNPDLVPDSDGTYYMTEKGKGWVDLVEHSIWALFVNSEFGKNQQSNLINVNL